MRNVDFDAKTGEVVECAKAPELDLAAIYLALVIERLIERALGRRHSAGAILGDMRKLECAHAEGEWWLSSHRTDLTDELFALIGEEAPRKWMTTSSLKALFKKGKEVRWKAL